MNCSTLSYPKARIQHAPNSEAWGLEAFREHRLSEYQLRTLLGLESRWDLHALFKERKVEMYTLEDWEEEWATTQEFRKTHPVGSRA